MHILVTSAGSSLAQHIIQGLAAEHDVRATERQWIDPPSGTPPAVHGQGLATAPNDRAARRIASEDAPLAVSMLGHDFSTNLLVRGVDVVIHCAEPLPGEAGESYLDYTTRCTYNLLMAASQEGASRIILLSTLALMTPYSPDFVVTERWRPLPWTDPLVMGKHLGEMVCREFAREFKIPVIVLRLGTWTANGQPSDMALGGDDLNQVIERSLHAAVQRWTVVHVQGEFPGARFPVGDAKKLLGFEPGPSSQSAQSGVAA